MIDLNDKKQRDKYLEQALKAHIAYNVHMLRIQNGLTQTQMAKKCGVHQSVISRLEDWDSVNLPTVQSLLDIASKMDVALIVRFAAWSEFIGSTQGLIRNYEEQTAQSD